MLPEFQKNQTLTRFGKWSAFCSFEPSEFDIFQLAL